LEDLELPERWLVDRRAPDQELETRQSAELARRALSALTREERDFLAACYAEEQAPVDLAAELGVRIGTVYSRKFKTREKLAKIVATLETPSV
ncbi:MAG: sigma-70 family RNA polymerase sigma factor, partial [Deltaproteobacteria bacterium]|nr:sigma-70 family RNA polymerase sigma factor [Deltaproteobacteria bacterium]